MMGRTSLLPISNAVVAVALGTLVICGENLVAQDNGAGLQVEPVVPAVKAAVQPKIDKHLAGPQTKVTAELKLGARMPAMFKLPVRVKGVSQPWAAMADLEKAGLDVAAASHKGVREVLDALSAAVGKPAGEVEKIEFGKPATLEDHAAHAIRVFDEAKRLRDEAIAPLTKENRKFIVQWTPTMVKNFGPQLPFAKQTHPLLQNDRAFCAFASDHFDWRKLGGSAKCLIQLTEPAHLASLQRTAARAHPIEKTVEGVTGPLLLAKETPHGLVLFGGKGKNTYNVKAPVALIVDFGGEDVYQGTVAAGFDADRANSMVIDLAGDDVYQCDKFGLATGRLGVGLLFDLAGSDTYKLAEGSGGTGFGGIGILCDCRGDDVYTGSKYTQGAAIAGVGLLLDLAGNDRHTGFGYAVGFAGPAAVGAVVDRQGDDSYQCGRKYPSGYNRAENPKAKPGDPKFQYDAMGLGMGLGRRILSSSPQHHAYALAGGLGMLIDLEGDDRYDGSNFSQASGYYFGIGLKLDLAGEDQHRAARYGDASGAHFGMGLSIDYAGNDVYHSTGPTYNGGCSWDHSIFLMIEGGDGNDKYQWDKSGGPARADIGAWGVFAELGGDDRYKLRTGLGRASKTGLAVFLDRAGNDAYDLTRQPEDFTPADGKVHSQNEGGLFVDQGRESP